MCAAYLILLATIHKTKKKFAQKLELEFERNGASAAFHCSWFCGSRDCPGHRCVSGQHNAQDMLTAGLSSPELGTAFESDFGGKLIAPNANFFA
jgi:hypothetical protein